MLTDAALKCLKPKAKMYKVSDRDGMYVRVAPSGAISFRLDYRLNGRRETVYLGRYARDGISLARARELCIDARRAIADQLRPKWPKLAAFIDESETDVLAHMDFPAQHRSKIHSTNPIERLNKEVKRRADVVGIFPNERSIIRLIGAVLLEANDEWQLQHRYMQTEPMAELMAPHIDDAQTQIATMAA